MPHRRLLAVLVAGQVLGGAATAAGIAVATILARDLLHGDALAGLAFAGSTFGSAFAAVPLSRRAARKGRRAGMVWGYGVGGSGAALCVVAAEIESFAVLIAGLFLFGAGNAANLLARYAAADLAPPERRGRLISLVVFATTVGAVTGPNLLEPSGAVAEAVGLPELSGPFLVSIVCFALAVIVEGGLLRPDPMEVAGALGADIAPPPRRSIGHALAIVRASPAATIGVTVMVVSHAVMVTVMAMTPLHMRGNGHGLGAVGIVISVHIAGMYALSPIVGVLVDRAGRPPVALAGAVVLVVATLLSASAGARHGVLVGALLLLGVGWSLALISGTALLTDGVPVAERASVQGVADLLMGGTAGVGGFASGLVVGVLGYEGLSVLAALASGGAAVAVLRYRLGSAGEVALDRLDESLVLGGDHR